MTPDVNVLVAAARSDHPHHTTAKAWLEQALAGLPEAPFSLMPMVIASFLRLVTSPKVFVQPTPANDAIAFVDALLAIGGTTLNALGAEWPLLRQRCLDKQLRGNALPDAWLAAAVEQHAEHLVTFDRGLLRLLGRSQVTVLAPLAT
jgi:hypothetical protein